MLVCTVHETESNSPNTTLVPMFLHLTLSTIGTVKFPLQVRGTQQYTGNYIGLCSACYHIWYDLHVPSSSDTLHM